MILVDMRSVLLLVLAFGQLPYAPQAFDLGRTQDQSLYDAFHKGYELPVAGTLDRAEIITEFRRAVLIVRDRAGRNERVLSERDLSNAMAPFEGQVGFVVQVRLNPLHTYVGAPPYEMYVSTGRATKPLAAKPMKREAVYAPGFGAGSTPVAVRLEGLFSRAGIEAASAPMLTILDDKADMLWQARIDLTRYR